MDEELLEELSDEELLEGELLEKLGELLEELSADELLEDGGLELLDVDGPLDDELLELSADELLDDELTEEDELEGSLGLLLEDEPTGGGPPDDDELLKDALDELLLDEEERSPELEEELELESSEDELLDDGMATPVSLDKIASRRDAQREVHPNCTEYSTSHKHFSKWLGLNSVPPQRRRYQR